MAQDSRPRSKRLKKILFFLSFVFISVVFFHRPILLLGCKVLLYRAISQNEEKKVSYERMVWEGDALVISGLRIIQPGSELIIDRIDLELAGSLLHFQPKISITHPQIVISSSYSQETSSFAFLYRNRFIEPHWEIKNGVLQMPMGGRFYFSLVPTSVRESLGTLVFSSDPNPAVPPMFSAELSFIEENLQVGFQLQESDLSRLMSLSALVFQNVPRHCEKASGEIQLQGVACLTPAFQLQELHCHGQGRQIELEDSVMGIVASCEEVSGTFSYPTSEHSNFLGDKISASLFLTKSSCLIKSPFIDQEMGVKNLEGQISLEPQKEPQLSLNGTLVQGDIEIPFVCSGKAGILPDTTFWSEIELVSYSSQGLASQTTFSLCNYEEGPLSLHLHVDNASADHLNFIRAMSKIPGDCCAGTATMTATFIYQEGFWQKATVENFRLENLHWNIPQAATTLIVECFSTACEFTKDISPTWSVDSLDLQIEGSHCFNPHFQISTLSANLKMDKTGLQSSIIKGQWGGLATEIALSGMQSAQQAEIKIHGDSGDVIRQLFGEAQPKIDALPLNLQISAQLTQNQLKIKLDGDVVTEPIHATAEFSLSSLSLPQLFAGSLPSWKFIEGRLQAEHLTDKSYGAFVPLIVADTKLLGDVNCEAIFLPSSSQIKITGNDLFIEHPFAQLYLPHVEQKALQFSYEYADRQWRGEIPLDEGKLNYRDLDLSFENLEGVLKIHDNQLISPTFYAECEGLALRGNLEILLDSKGDGQLSLETSQIAGNVQSLFSILRHFPSLHVTHFPLEGNFSSGDQGLVLKTSLGLSGQADWHIRGHFNGLTIPVNDVTAITQGECDLIFDSRNQRLFLEKGKGLWPLLDGSERSVQVKRFSTQFGEVPAVDFALKVADGKKEIAHLEGKMNRSSQGQWEVIFDQQMTHIGEIPLNITHCTLNPQMKLASFEMKPIIKCQDVHRQAAFLQNAGFLSQSFSPKNLQEWQFEGSLQTRLFSENAESGFSFHAESRDLKVRGKPWTSFQLKAHKVGENWLIEHLEGGGLTLKGAFIVDGDELSCPHLEGYWQGTHWKGSGKLKTDQKHFSCAFESIKGDLTALNVFQKPLMPLFKGTFAAGAIINGNFSDRQNPLQLTGEINLCFDLKSPLALTATNNKKIKFTYDNHGFICDGIDLQFRDKMTGTHFAEIKAERLSNLLKQGVCVQQLKFSFSPQLFNQGIESKALPSSLRNLRWGGNLQGEGNLNVSEGITFQGGLRPGDYGWGFQTLPFEQLQVHYEKNRVTLRAKTQMQNQPIWGILQIDLAKDPYGTLMVFDHPKSKGLKILFSTSMGKINLESVQGSCYGILCDLVKNSKRKVSGASVLSGSLHLDVNAFRPLLSKEIQATLGTLKLGHGYKWEGDLILGLSEGKKIQANGVLSGNEFEVLGYQFRHFHGNLEATPDRLSIMDLKVEDSSGLIGIKKIEFYKNEGWRLYIPQVLVRQLQPSLMRKINGEQPPIKPFTIKSFVLSEIHARLGDMTSLEGSGRLTFVNQFKKESSIFDVPLEMIKKIGLDPGLLTPVQGELEMELRGDKFYLLSLQNAFSEGQRSEFYLAPSRDLSYIDLEGRVSIDLKMHQDVMLKITEPFTLTIRGTLEKPRYGLQ